ncbi:MAG: cytochrome c [Planctomycetes bacterium]|nr:cytochrome c [Planctomycetota bacterium]
MRRYPLFLILVLAVGVSTVAYGATIKLKDGSELQGDIIEQGKTVVKIRIAGGLELEIDGEQVAAVDGKPYKVDKMAAYEERLQAIDDTKAEDQYELGMWCKKRGMPQAKVHFEKALTLDPTHEGANRALGRVFVKREGKWMTPYDAQKKGYRVSRSTGEWVTETEAMRDKGFKEYKRAMLSQDEINRMKENEFSRWKNYYYTHEVYRLKGQLLRINLFNKLALSKDQMDQMYVILAEAANEAEMFMESRHAVNQEAEAAFNALRYENQKGVYRSFDTPRSVQQPAGAAEGALKKLPKAFAHTMAPYLERVEKVLAQSGPRTQKGSQLFKVDHEYCMCCHNNMAQNNECGACHRGNRLTKANPQAMAALKEVRAMSGADWAKRKDEIIRRWMKPVTARNKKEQKMREMDEYASVERVLTNVRDLDATAFENDKQMLASQLAAKNDIARARTESAMLRDRMSKMKHAHKTEAMMVDCFFDGTMFEIMQKKVKRPKALLASRQKTTLVERQNMFDGKQLMERTCTKCHRLDRVMRRIREAPLGAEWHEHLKKMLGAMPVDVQAASDQIVDYLIELESKNSKKQDEF